jgi:hypothetical protein
MEGKMLENMTAVGQLDKLLKNSVMLLNDADTFLVVRTSAAPMNGGGNWLIVLACFAVLNLYSKVYTILEKGMVADEAYSAGYDRYQELISNGEKSLKGLNPIVPEKREMLNEADCFCRLVKALPDSFNLGITHKQAAKVWKDFRNTPAHMAGLGFDRGGSTFVETVGWDYKSIKAAIDNRDKPSLEALCVDHNDIPQPTTAFYQESGNEHWQVHSDILAGECRHLYDWLIEKAKEASQDNVLAALKCCISKFN